MSNTEYIPIQPIQPKRPIVVLALVMIGPLIAAFAWADMPVIAFLCDARWYNQWTRSLTELGDAAWWIPSLLAGALVALLMKKPKLGMRLLHAGLTIVIAGLLVNAIKVTVARYRPGSYYNYGLWGYQWLAFKLSYHCNSFPSGHSSTIAILCTALWLWRKNLWWLWVLIWAAVASTRSMLLSHWPSDVIVGSYLGAVMTLLLHNPIARWVNWLGPPPVKETATESS